jgi:4-aminobutyrate aminotransferase-like enzyme
VPPTDFYPAIERICRKNGILFVMDEVATGFGRCGTLFASELWDVKPDIVCLGKGMTGGYGTMGATLVTEAIFKASRGIPFYSTFGWNAVDLAAARANVEVILKEKLWENSKGIGNYLLEHMRSLEELPYVGEVRGVGLLLGIEIVKDKKSKKPDWPRSQKIQDQCAAESLILETAGHTLFITPPLTLTKQIADEGIQILNKVML